MSAYHSFVDLGGNTDHNVQDPNLSTGAVMPFGRLSMEIVEVRKQTVNWQSYVQCQMINQEDYTMIADYDCMGVNERAAILEHKGDQFAKTCLSLLARLSRDQTIRYILVLIDDMLCFLVLCHNVLARGGQDCRNVVTQDQDQELRNTSTSGKEEAEKNVDAEYHMRPTQESIKIRLDNEAKNRVYVFHEFGKKAGINIWVAFLKLLNRPDQFIVHQTAIIIAKLASWGKVQLPENDLNYFLTWLKGGLSYVNNEYIHSVAQCLQLMLRVDEYRKAFFKIEGIASVVAALLGQNVGFQLQYQLIFALWLLSFDPRITQRMIGGNAVIRVLADILRDSGKEKVTRIIIATLRNLLQKSEDKKNEASLSMIQCKLLPVLSVLNGKTWADEDISNDVEFVYETLNERVQDLSTFDEYAAEVTSGRLEWSPVHKSEKFWRENAQRLNEKNYELLKILTRLLETSADPLILAVAAHDTGEYVRHYPRGKNVLEHLGLKVLVMKMMTHNDPNVRKEALLAVQKLMVHNWEYLGKQLKAA